MDHTEAASLGVAKFIIMSDSRKLDPQLSGLLQSLRQRIRRYIVIDSLLAIAAVVLGAFWIGLALDYLPVQVGGTEMPRLARTLLLLVVAVAVISIAITMLMGRLHRKLPDDSLALLVERQHPQIGGRLVTAVQLQEPGREGDSHSNVMLKRVHDQAAKVIDEVDPNKVFRWQPLVRKGMIAGPLAFCVLVFVVMSPSAFGLALSRLTLLSDQPWPRRADLEMVGVELPIVTAAEEENAAPQLVAFENQVMRLPRGSNGTLRIRARADGAELPVVCTVYYRTDDGTRGQSNMRRVGRIVDGYQSFVLDGPPLADLSESMLLSVRGLDDRLDNFRIEAVEPPAITSMNVQVRYPDYLRSEGATEFDLQTDYQAGLRIREGSTVSLVGTSSRQLGGIDVLLKTDTGNVDTVPLTLSEDGTQFDLPIAQFNSATTVRLVPRDTDGISAQAAYRYFLGVVLDEPPLLDVSLDGIGTAVTPAVRIPIKANATDDYGVEKLDLFVTTTDELGETSSAGLAPPLDRDGNAETVIDLREMINAKRFPEVIPGDAISLFGEAADAYDLEGNHLTRSEVYRLQVVTPEQLLALLERRELALRARLEQTVTETRNLRDTLNLLRRGFEDAPNSEDPAEQTRILQLRRLRAQQSGLQANKTSEELAGIAASLDDILQEMINNRVDSVDRRERIGAGVRDPLRKIVAEPLQDLRDQIAEVEKSIAEPQIAAEKTVLAVESAEYVLLQLTAVLDKMLELESYNEILDMVRELIEDQQGLLDDTIDKRKNRLRNLFK